jgi:prepilin-type N-terminal cleavage/methylation domain-containing protein
MKLIILKYSGFTLIELLVVIGITAIMSTAGLFMYRNYSRRQVVVQTAEQVRTSLSRARQRALSGERQDSCKAGKSLIGYRLECANDGNEYQIFGVYSPACNPSLSQVEDVFLPSGVTFTNCSRFIFNALGNGTDLPDDIRIELADSANNGASFVVEKSGNIGKI